VQPGQAGHPIGDPLAGQHAPIGSHHAHVMVALGPIDPNQQHRQLPPRLDIRFWPGGGGGNLMEQCSNSARHPTSRQSPRLAGGGTVLTKGLSCAHSFRLVLTHRPGHTATLPSQGYCIAISSFLLGRRHRPAGTARGWRAACGGSSLTPGRAGWSR
jgi:hypothetical protein